MGNGKCDDINNTPECEYDSGDCCHFDCLENCRKKLEKGLRCLYKCGSTFYNCKKTDKCDKCKNGKCLEINDCYKDDFAVKRSIDNCIFNKKSMGDSQTIDSYCGKDPNKTNVHYPLDLV